MSTFKIEKSWTARSKNNVDIELGMTYKGSMYKVWVLVYQHRYGTDVSVYDSQEGAQDSVWNLIDEALTELQDPEIAGQIRAALDRNELDLAQNLWCDCMNEDFTICERAIQLRG